MGGLEKAAGKIQEMNFLGTFTTGTAGKQVKNIIAKICYVIMFTPVSRSNV